MTTLGRSAEARPLLAALEADLARLGGPWGHAVTARCRAMILAAEGELDAALRSAEQALALQRELELPFETARTKLLLGQLQHRARRRGAADTLRRAAEMFEQLGAALWEQRARTELDRVTIRWSRGELTAAEQRVAELVVSGMTNKEVAATLFVSPKTVEATLSRVYRKLGIRGRTALAASLGAAETGPRD